MARRPAAVGRILVSINPFVPKPWTPFQWEPMEDLRLAQAEARAASAARSSAHPGGAGRDREPARRRTCRRCCRAAIVAWRRCCERLHADPERLVADAARAAAAARTTSSIPIASCTARYAPDELLPWDFIDHAVDKRYLLAERRKALGEVQTPPCDTHTCHACGAC